MIRLIKKNYHWVIALLVFFEMIVYGGLINSASVFVLPICTDLEISTTAFSVATMPYTIACCLGTSITGLLFSRFGFKKMAMLSLAITALSLFLTAFANTVYMYAFCRFLFGVGYGCCYTAATVRIIQSWFHKHLGLVMGAVSMATGLGGSLMTMVLNKIVGASGWRTAYLVAGAIVVAVTLSYLLIKDQPEQMGLRPFGFGTLTNSKQKAHRETYDWPGLSMKEQWRNPAFYLMCFSVLVCCVCLYTTSSFVVPHFVSIGFTPDRAAAYQAVYMLAVAAAKVILGLIHDRFGPKLVMLLCMACAVSGQLLLGWTVDPALSLAGILLFAVALCMSSFVIPLLTTPIFGYRTCLTVNGIFLGISSLGTLFSSPIASMCYDATGLYSPVYKVTGLVNAGITVLFLVLFAIAKKERKEYYQKHPDERE